MPRDPWPKRGVECSYCGGTNTRYDDVSLKDSVLSLGRYNWYKSYYCKDCEQPFDVPMTEKEVRWKAYH